MLQKLRTWIGRPSMEAATNLPSAPLPTEKTKGGRSLPSFFTSAKMAANPLPRTDRGIANVDLLTYRSNSTSEAIRTFSRVSPELSAAVHTALRIGITSQYTAIAYTAEGVFSPEATAACQQLLTRFDFLGDPTEGYSNIQSLKSVSESLGREVMLEGAMALELVLDKARLPYKLQPVSVSQIEWVPETKGVRPIQKVGSETIDLDTPCFIYQSVDPDLLSAYASSPLESAVKAVLMMETFQADLTRVIKRAIHPRLTAKLDEEKIRKFLSPEAQIDPELATNELNSIISGIETKLNGLNPEDALVYLDSIDISVKNDASTGLADEWGTLQEIANSRLASGSKTLPSILGLPTGDSSSNIASTQAAVYLKTLDGLVRQTLNSVYSRALTVAIRLLGHDAYVKFCYDELTLRTPLESEAFLQSRQQRVLEQLSLGLITDEEASLKLTGRLPPAGYVKLSGTHFKTGGAADTMGIQEPSNSGSTLNQKSNPDTPTTARGQNNRK